MSSSFTIFLRRSASLRNNRFPPVITFRGLQTSLTLFDVTHRQRSEVWRGVAAHEQRCLQQAAILVIHLEASPAHEWMAARLVIHEAMLPPVGSALAKHGVQHHIDRYAAIRNRRSH